MNPALEHARDEIERIDRELIGLLAECVRIARSVGALKRELGMPVLDPAREAAVVRRAAQLASAQQLPAEPVRDVFWQIIGLCRRAQDGLA